MTSFHTPRNGVSAIVAANRAIGAPIPVTDGSVFGAATPLIATAVRGANVLCILEITGVAGNTLAVSGAIEGTTDAALVAGDRIEMRPTALALTEVQDAVHALESDVADLVALEATTVYSTGSYADPSWIASISGAKVSGDIAGNAASITGSIVQSQVAGLTPSLASKADDAAALHTTGDETKTGTLTAPLRDKGGRGFDVRAFGAVVDGVTNDTAAIRAAQAAAGATIPLLFPAGTCLVDDTLFSSLAGYSSFTWIGSRSARGCNAGASFPASTIKFRPSDTSKWLVRAADTTAGQEGATIGPYVVKDLAIDVGDANGFMFGLEDVNSDGTSDVVADGTGQAYINGVRFEGCALSAAAADRASVSGVITRSGRTLIHLTKCFESTIRDTSLYGCDTQVRTWGCDRPTLHGVRSQGAHLPFDFNGSGTFTVQHSLANIEIEGWTFTPIRGLDCNLSVSDLSLEQNDGTPAGSGRYALPGTVAIAADSDTLTFGQSMDGILWPGLSLVEVTDGTNTITLKVEAVSGATVTVDASTDGLGTPTGTSTNVVTWTAAAATATRIHGYGPIHDSKFSASYKGVTFDASAGCPSLVYVVNRGTLNVAGGADAGIHTGIASVVIGNIPAGPNFMDGVLNFSDSSPTVLPPLDHPFVTVDHMGGSYAAAAYDANRRAYYGTLSDAVGTVRRVWAFTPKRSAAASDYSYAHNPAVTLAGDPGTDQAVHAWLKRDASGLFHCSDPTLPNAPGSSIRLRFRARSVGATGSLGWFFTPVNGGSFVRSVALTDVWQTFDVIQAMPTEWTTARDGAVAIEFNGSDYYLAGLLIEEVPGGPLLPTLADAAAPDNSLFFGSDHLDGSSKPQLCRKQGGTTTPIG